MLRDEYYRVLRCLERRLVARAGARGQRLRERIHGAILAQLPVVSMESNFDSHYALLKLSRNAEGQTLLVTPNFDTAFERTWLQKRQYAIDSHAGPALPQP